MKKITTLCTIYKDGKLLLGMKKRGFGEGKWNGFGGKVKEGETVKESVIRETKEEAGIEIKEMEKVGIIDFYFKKSGEIIEVNLFICKGFMGEPMETEEMKPRWFPVDKIPYDLMWPDDKFWIPLFLEGKKFKGKFIFDKDTLILSHNLEVVENL